MYSIVVNRGVDCWLIHLTNPNPAHWTVLGSRITEKGARELANDILSDLREEALLVN